MAADRRSDIHADPGLTVNELRQLPAIGKRTRREILRAEVEHREPKPFAQRELLHVIECVREVKRSIPPTEENVAHRWRSGRPL